MCDGKLDCPRGDDEVLCELGQCFRLCICEGLMVYCAGKQLTTLAFNEHSRSVRYLDLSHNYISTLMLFQQNFPYLKYLNVSSNFIIRILGSFQSSRNLEILDLSYNKLQKIDKLSVKGLQSLKEFYLLGNPLSKNFLNLDRTDTFGAMIYLLPIFNVCCVFQRQIKVGCERTEELRLSSCEYVVKHSEIRALSWTIGILAILCNLHQLVYECRRRKEDYVRFVFMLNTVVAGLLMSCLTIFTSVLAQSDAVSIIPDLQKWRQHPLCSVISVLFTYTHLVCFGAIATLAIQNFMLPYLKMDNHQSNQLIMLKVSVVCNVILTYIIPIFLATAPVIPFFGLQYHVAYYDEICSPFRILLLGHTVQSQYGLSTLDGARIYVLVLFVALNLSSLLVVLGCALFCFVKECKERRRKKKDQEMDELAASFRHYGYTTSFSWALAFVLVYDSLVWFIIAILGE